jgi:DNA polymerase-3 subunit delta
LTLRYTSRNSFLAQIKSAASTGFLARVYFVGVPHDYERTEVCEEILRYLPAGHLLERFSGSGLDTKALSDHMNSNNLFGGEPVALIEDAEKIPKGALQQILPVSYGYLILAAKGKSTLSETLEKEGIILDLLNEKPWEKEKRIQAQLELKVRNTGKTITSDALALLFERQDLDIGLLEREIDKLICYTGDRLQIQAGDVAAITTASRSFALWQTAESLIWEGTGSPDEDHFHSLIPALRAQLQLGLKISSLLTANASREEWNKALPKVFPKTLEKRTTQAQRLGLRYFARGLIDLFDIELKSRTGATQYGALLDLFRIKLSRHL